MSVTVANLEKRYGSQKALDDISFTVAPGEIVGLLGPNGAGKSTTMKILTGFIDRFEGDVHILGMDIRSETYSIKRRIGYLPEHNPLYLDMYVREYLYFMADIYNLNNARSRIDRIIEITGLQSEGHKIIRALSKGYRQRVGLAQALIHDPEILILDEPTTGLDPNQLVEIRQLIKDLGEKKTVIFSSHIMQEVQALCDRVIILHQGRLLADDQISSLNEVVQNQRVIHLLLDRDFSGQWILPDLVETVQNPTGEFVLRFKKASQDPRGAIFDFVVKEGMRILEMKEYKSNMEDVFQKITKV